MSLVRKATDADLPNIMAIANVCFPHSIYWSIGNESAYKFWKFSINAEVSEVWLCENSKGVQGFSLNILNAKDWTNLIYEFKISIFKKLVLAFHNPKRGYLFVRKAFEKKYNFDLPVYSPFPLDPVLFVDLFAVAPSSRRNGVASKLVIRNIERAYQLNRKSVLYSVDRDNLPMLKLMLKHKFVPVAGSRRQVTFAGKIA